MDIQRAKEITESPDLINVSYNGDSIYIQEVNEANQTARIYNLKQPEDKQEVSLEGLKEV